MTARPAGARRAAKKPPPRNSLRVVRGRTKGLIRRAGGRRVAPTVIACAVLVVATISVVLIEQVMLAQTAFKVAKMRERIVKAEARHAELVLQAAQLGSSERIERVARRDLGMVAPEEVHYVVANVKTRGNALAHQQPKALLPSDGQTAALEGAP